MRLSIGKAALLALATTLAGSAAVSCSSKDDEKSSKPTGDVGSIDLNLEVAPGINVNVVNWAISGGPSAPLSGTINVTDPGATISALIGGLLPGDYTITLTAVSTDGVVQCSGSASFPVLAGQLSSVSVDLQCSAGETRGAVTVNGNFNSCPTLTSWIAAPLQVSTLGQIEVSAAASDLNPASTITFAWSATGGTFVAPGSAATQYNCSLAGPQTLTITASDGECTDTATIAVTCVTVGCGNGTVNPGETCDDGNTSNGDACPADCTLPVCGDGIIESVPGNAEVCDDGNQNNSDNCPNDCSPAVCGDGVLEGAEVCDDGNQNNGDACPNDCSPAVCGDGVAEGTEQCDDGNQTNGDGCENNCTTSVAQAVCGNTVIEPPSENCDPPTSEQCGSTCQEHTTSACLTCEQGNECVDTIDLCDSITGNAIAGPATGVSRSALCFEVLQCARTTDCGLVDPQRCYCGNAPTADCIAGLGNGACKTAIERGHESTSASFILANYLDLNRGGGAAMARITCDQVNCNPVCF